MERSSSSSSDQVDWISKVEDDVLALILSRLSTEEAIRTSVVSKRWKHVWKHMSHLVLDKPNIIINSTELRESFNRVETLITKVINNHLGALESCVINHFGVSEILNTWIQLATCVKHTKALTLIDPYMDIHYPTNHVLDIPTNSFSHPSLTSLSLSSYILKSSHPFGGKCSNLRILKLRMITASDVEVFNRVLASCSALEVLVLDINCVYTQIGSPLKFESNTLKVLHVPSMYYIDGIQASATSLDILVIEETSFNKDAFSLHSPKLQFSRNFWVASAFVPHISYNISKEENKSIAHEEFMNNISPQFFRSFEIRIATMSVCVDLRNRTEVERLRQVLRLWNKRKMMEGLEIIFKRDNNKKDESWQKKFWEENNKKDAFPSADFRVKTVWMNNFSGSKEEFAFASCLIRQGSVVEKMMIKTTSFPARKKLEIEAAVASLRALQTQDQWELIIQCF